MPSEPRVSNEVLSAQVRTLSDSVDHLAKSLDNRISETNQTFNEKFREITQAFDGRFRELIQSRTPASQWVYLVLLFVGMMTSGGFVFLNQSIDAKISPVQNQLDRLQTAGSERDRELMQAIKNNDENRNVQWAEQFRLNQAIESKLGMPAVQSPYYFPSSTGSLGGLEGDKW